MMKRLSVMIIVLLAMTLALACDDKKADDKVAEQPKDEKAEAAAEATPPVDAAPAVETFAGSHILIAYKGAMRAAPTVTRTKEEAKALATKLAAELVKAPDKLEEAAKANSDCPSAPSGGDLGSWQKGMMVPEFDVAIAKMAVGAVTGEPVETPFGFHVIRRNKAMAQEEVSAVQIMIQYKGSIGSDQNPKEITISKDEAKALIEKLLKEAKADPAKFEELAEKNNDAPTAKLPIWTTGQRMPKEFDQAVLGIKIGEISDVIESPFGFHLFKRLEVVHQPKVSGSHILIQYKGAKGAPATVTRTKEEAIVLANRVMEDAKKAPEKFGEFAMKHSEDPSAAMNGGDLGVWELGEMLPEFDNAIKAMKIDEIGGPVESMVGLHIIKRNSLDKKVKIELNPATP